MTDKAADARAEGGTNGAQRGLATVVGGVAGLTLISRALGFLRWIVQAATVGTGAVAGAYATANQIPNVLYEVVVGGALAATIVPLLAGAVMAGDRETVSRTASAMLSTVLVILVPLGILLAVLADPIAELFPTSVDADPGLQTRLVADFLRMFALQVPLYGIGVVLTGILQAHRRFAWPALTPILSSLVVMTAYALYGAITPEGAGQWTSSADPAGLLVLGWGTTLGVAALSLPLLIPASRLDIDLRLTLRLDAATRRRAWGLATAGITALVAQQAFMLLVPVLARSGGVSGTIAVYQYTQAIWVLPYAVLVVPVATVLYPRIAGLLAEGAAIPPASAPARAGASAVVPGRCEGSPREEALRLCGDSTALVTSVSLAGMAMLLAASAGAEAFFALLTDDVRGMSAALVSFAPGIVGFGLIHQITRILFAAGRARWAAHATALGWAVAAVLSTTAVRLLAPGGADGPATLKALGIGTSIGMTIAGIGLLAGLARCLEASVLRPIARVILAGAPVAAASGWAGRALSQMTGAPWSQILLSGIWALLAALATIIAAHIVCPPALGALRWGRR
ncbi:murein biosynthesis integral membrane protein MurJ [Actinomyces gaoshouyii]|uniref:Membrane protein n=1 Tax=Actinomyces gaoshouyii TaxID=1960083 RepID=A0A8H9HBG9_9ACTO|nr:lipid II flippase MurJ [Actinomyces gaoshouyii]GGO98314.1 membrane protein [Actinomyces gaoshouyii]